MMRRIIFPVACLLLAACGGNGEDTAVTGVRGVSDAEIIIGSQNDLSGPAAVIGVAAINGARMYFEDVNAAGGVHGRHIRFVVEDAQYQVPKAIQATNKLVNRDGIFAMILGMGTPMNNAIMPTLFDKNIPNLFPMTGARSMSEPFQRLQFVTLGTYYDQTQAAIKYFVGEKGASRPCVIYQDTDFGQEILEGAVDQLAAMGLELAARSAHKPTDTEFTAAILRLRNASCDLVLMGTIHKDTILILEAARKLGWENVQWVGTTASYVAAVAEMESGASEGFSVFQDFRPLHRDDPEIDPKVADWWDRYIER
jgi:branched-chain amino acid transport system substrate-binding protein